MKHPLPQLYKKSSQNRILPVYTASNWYWNCFFFSSCKHLKQCTSRCFPLTGRYNKFSRILSQTPWIIDNVRLYESSVEVNLWSFLPFWSFLSSCHVKKTCANTNVLLAHYCERPNNSFVYIFIIITPSIISKFISPGICLM